jgi:hypothetical protein
MHDYTALPEHEIETEVDRYIAWPAQALSYYMGELAIVRAREKAEKTLGAKFNIRAFHDAVLELGSVPLPLSRRGSTASSMRTAKALTRILSEQGSGRRGDLLKPVLSQAKGAAPPTHFYQLTANSARNSAKNRVELVESPHPCAGFARSLFSGSVR